MTKMHNKKSKFTPTIISFVCNWSAYNILRKIEFRLPANMHYVRVMCLGRINPSFIFKAFELGVDGVLLLGCSPGECHYNFGNRIAEEHFNIANNVMHLLGVEKERLSLIQVSNKDYLILVRSMKKFINVLKRVGPSPFKIDTSEKVWTP